jgi:hypothetical protein
MSPENEKFIQSPEMQKILGDMIESSRKNREDLQRKLDKLKRGISEGTITEDSPDEDL